MTTPLSHRFAAGLLTGLSLLGSRSASALAPPSPALRPFPPGAVTLDEGPFLDAFARNRDYLASFEPDRLLWTFRANAGLPTPGKPLGGWESPDIELRGHSIGHYLSACAHLLRQREDPTLRANADAVVVGLAACQEALGGGYLSAFPEEFLDRVEAGKPVWAPYYTIHKIMAGLLAMHELLGNDRALAIVRGMADHIEGRCRRLDDEAMQRMLGNEFGGMEEALLDLFAATRDDRYLALAERFRKRAFLEPLHRGEDPLPGLHANTHLAQIAGQVRAHELTGDPVAKEVVTRFWEALQRDHSYVTGGSNSGEYWGPPGRLAATLSATNQEFCTSHNSSRITASLLRWSGEARYADEWERIVHNGILVSQHPVTGMLIYYLPLANGLRKEHGTPFDTMTCCYGTGIEAYTQFAESIYFRPTSGDDDVLIAQFIPSTLRWATPAAGTVVLRQRTDFPASGSVTFDLIEVEQPAPFTITLRVPGWATLGVGVEVNGEPVAAGSPTAGGWLPLRRVWRSGDRIAMSAPLPLRVVTMPDDPGLGAIVAGPVVLAGLVDEANALDDGPVPPMVGDKLAPASWLRPTGEPLTWRSEGMPVDRTFVPLSRVVEERYGVYWPFGAPGGARSKEYESHLATRRERERRTIDSVRPAEHGSESSHAFAGERTESGLVEGRGWRHAASGGHFRYRLRVDPEASCVLAVTYYGSDTGQRIFDILVEGERVASERLHGQPAGRFFTTEYAIPDDLTAGKSSVEVRFQPAPNGTIAGGVFGVALLRAN